NEADVLAYGTQTITLPPNQVTERNCSVSITGPGATLLAGKKMIAAMPHMHQLGSAIETWVDRGGQRIDLGTVTNWDFNSQYWMPLDVTLEKGDVVRTRCAWDNTTGQTVKFGEATDNEMCYSFTMYYPRMVSPVPGYSVPWMTPATTSQCN